jgi:hypothetical protein
LQVVNLIVDESSEFAQFLYDDTDQHKVLAIMC